MKQFFILCLALFSCCLLHAKDEAVDLVVFSYNRPMQLYAFLESSDKYITHLNQVHAIVRASDEEYRQGYQTVALRFPTVHFHYQEPDDFKSLVMQTAFNKYSKCPYLMFAVDDMIVTESVDLSLCSYALTKRSDVWCFSLRLGTNITFCGRRNTPQKVPEGININEEFFLWKFRDVKERGDWNYPNSTDMTIYRKKDLFELFAKTDFTNPNTLERAWSRDPAKRPGALSFIHSKAINIPMNVVNPYFSSPNMQITTRELLRRFRKGEKIDIDQFAFVENDSPHVNYEPTFIRR